MGVKKYAGFGGKLPGPRRGCTLPGAGRCRPSSAGLHPPFSLGLAQRKRAVHGPKERRFSPLYTKATGDSSDSSDQIRKPSAGCGVPFLFGSFPPQVAKVRQLSGRKTEKSILLLPRVTRIPGQSRREAKRSTPINHRSRAQRSGAPAANTQGPFGFPPTKTAPPRLAAEQYRICTVYSALGRRFPGFCRQRLRRPPV